MKRFTLLGALAVAGLCFVSLPASAQSFSDADRTAVEARISRLDGIVSSGDLAGAMEVLPPVLFRTIAERAGATEAQLLEVSRELIRTQLSGVTILDYAMDLAAAPPTLTPDGSQTYLLIPTTTLMEIPEVGRVRSRNHTLALEEGGEWYLIRVDEPAQADLVRELWPAFVGVDFPGGTTEIAD